MYIIVVYDEGDIKAQSKIRNMLRMYLQHVQLSVFEGEVSPSQLTEIKLKLNSMIKDGGAIVYVTHTDKAVKRYIIGKSKDVSKSNII